LEAKTVTDAKIYEVYNSKAAAPNRFLIETGIFLYSNSTIGISSYSGDSSQTPTPSNINGGYIFSYSKNLVTDESSIFNATQRGCSPNILSTNKVKSKYYKICKVNGGSGLGRGTLGMLINYNSCKFFMPSRQKSELFPLATPGVGGEISHFTAVSDNAGYGGGTVFLISDKMDLKCPIHANGGESFKRGYIFGGGGGGGSVKLIANKILGISEVLANGGMAADVLGGGGGGKLILGSSDKNFYDGAQFPQPGKYEFNHGGIPVDNNSGPEFFMNQMMLIQAKPCLYKGGIVNLEPCPPGAYGNFCTPCPVNTYKPQIGMEECLKCPCDLKNTPFFWPITISNSTALELPITRNRISTCGCMGYQKTDYTLVNIFVTLLIVIFLAFVLYLILLKRDADEGLAALLRLDVKDVPYSLIRLDICGTNCQGDAWH
jgi:hypothetical protein